MDILEMVMASLYIKNSSTAERVERMARHRGTTKTALVDRALDALDRAEPNLALQIKENSPPTDPVMWLDWHRARNPLPSKVRETDKTFFDRLWGEPD